jgi:pyruvate,water dikinase
MSEPSWLVEEPHNPRYPFWTRAVVGEMVADPPSPLGWTMFWDPCISCGWREALVSRFGFDEEDLAGAHPPTVAAFGGHPYLNASMIRVLAHRMANLGVDQLESLITPGATPLPPYRHEPWHDPEPVTAKMLNQWFRWVLESGNQIELDQACHRVDQALADRPKYGELTDLELVHYALSLQPIGRMAFAQHVNQTLAARIGPRIVGDACVQVGQPAHTLRLLSGLGNVDPVSPTLALWELSRLVRSSPGLRRFFDQGLDGLDRVLRHSNQPEAYALMAGVNSLVSAVGFRGPNEWDLASPTWDVAHDIVLALIGCMHHCGDELAPRQRRRHLEADRQRLVEEIANALDDERRPIFLAAAESSATFLRGRERSRSVVMRVLHRMRSAIREVAVRGERRGDFARRDDIWMLTSEELEYYADGGLADVRHLTALRQAEYEMVQQHPLQLIVSTGDDPDWSWSDGRAGPRDFVHAADGDRRLEPGDIILGSPGSPGMARGEARVIETDADLAEVRPGEIIILARPSLVATPLFVAAGAVVTDVGGTFTHAAVVARELGTPMVAGAQGASERIPSGAIVNVDGLTGVVSVESPSPLADEVGLTHPSVA